MLKFIERFIVLNFTLMLLPAFYVNAFSLGMQYEKMRNRPAHLKQTKTLFNIYQERTVKLGIRPQDHRGQKKWDLKIAQISNEAAENIDNHCRLGNR